MGKKKYIFTPEMDEQIRTLYQTKVAMKSMKYAGPVKKLAEKFGIPRWRVSSRARALGVMPVQKKEPPWSDTELFMLKQSAHRSPPVVRRYLKRAGYKRSVQGIMIKRTRMHFSRATMNGYTCRLLAGLFGIDDHAIAGWIKKGWLKAQRRGTARTEVQGGDEWFIRPEAVKEFVIASVAVIDFRKVDKYWLVEILTKEVQGSRFRGSRVTHLPEIVEPTDDYDITTDVMDLFDEAQGAVKGVY